MPDLALQYACELIRRPSVTPEDGGCQDYIEAVLSDMGFVRTCIDRGGVRNSIYERDGETAGLLAFAGHTDVVPPGPEELWPYPPFSAQVVRDASGRSILYGRGAQDMKGGIACFLAALRQLHAQGVPLPGVQLLITSDEEGESVDGTVRIVEYLAQRKRLPQAAIVGEPSCRKSVGDTIRRGRRGVVQARLRFSGRQGHSAYPQDADNAIHRALPALAAIAALDWGVSAPGFPPTTCQVTNLQAGTGATNVIPGRCHAVLDIRYNPANDFDTIRQRIEACCDEACEIVWDHVAKAFSTPECAFLDLVDDAILRCTGLRVRRDTGGGTSDGRFLAAVGVPVAELGLTNATIHQTGECVAVEELAVLTRIYAHILRHFTGEHGNRE